MTQVHLSLHVLFAAIVISLVTAVVAADKSDRLNHESLKLMLENMGYEIHKAGKYNSGAPWYQLKFKEGGADYFVMVSLPKDQKTVWVIADLVNLDKQQELPRVIAIKMLDHNYIDSKHVYFSFGAKGRHLRLKGALPNRSVTPIALRTLIRETLETLKTEKQIWEPKKWPQEDKGTMGQPKEGKAAH